MAKKIMSKKEMLKEQERIKKEKQLLAEDFKKEDIVKNLIGITIGVVLFLAIVYFGINILKGNIKFGKEEIVIDDTVEDGVICGTLLTQSDPEYYVLAYNYSDVDKDVYKTLVNNYSGSMKIYNMDLESGFNKSCVGEKEVISNDLSKLKLTSPVLLSIKNGKIEKAYSTKEDITKILIGN